MSFEQKPFSPLTTIAEKQAINTKVLQQRQALKETLQNYDPAKSPDPLINNGTLELQEAARTQATTIAQGDPTNLRVPSLIRNIAYHERQTEALAAERAGYIAAHANELIALARTSESTYEALKQKERIAERLQRKANRGLISQQSADTSLQEVRELREQLPVVAIEAGRELINQGISEKPIQEKDKPNDLPNDQPILQTAELPTSRATVVKRSPLNTPGVIVPANHERRGVRRVQTRNAETPPDIQRIQHWVDYQVDLHGTDLDRKIRGRDQDVWEFLRNFNQSILFEDDHLLIVNKPPNVSSHYRGNDPIGVEEIARHERQDQARLAHRLDRDTSGVLVLTKSARADIGMYKQFQDKTGSGMRKLYVAVLEGALRADRDIRVDVPLAEQANTFMRVVKPHELKDYPQAKPSTTIFRPLAVLQSPTGERRTLTDVQIMTGRTHQIRVVAADYLDHPIAGDRIYNPKGNSAIPRQM